MHSDIWSNKDSNQPAHPRFSLSQGLKKTKTTSNKQTNKQTEATTIMDLWFLMTDSIYHSSLPRTVLEKVTLTTIQFRIYLRTKVDPMFQCVYIRTPLKSWPYKSSATCAWSVARLAEKTRLNICANNKGADQPARPRRLISAFVARYSSFFFSTNSVSQT